MYNICDFLAVESKSEFRLSDICGDQKMDRISTSDENYDVGYEPSPSSVDQSLTDATSYSLDSFAYCRTNSEASAFSDDHAYSDVASPLSWQGLKSPARAALSRLGMRQHKHGLDDEIMDLGELSAICILFFDCIINIVIGVS